MPQPCSVCNHKDHPWINELIQSNIGISEIARRFKLNPSSVSRHKLNHLKMAPKNGPGSVSAQVETPLSSDPADQLRSLKTTSHLLLNKLTDSKDVPVSTAVSLLREIRAQLIDIEKLQPRVTAREALEDNSEWLEFRDTVIEALRAYPEAKAAVISAIAEKNR
jgi:hypothetical protein